MRSLFQAGLIASFVCGSFLAISNRSLQAQAVKGGGVHGGAHVANGFLGHGHLGFGSSCFGFGSPFFGSGFGAFGCGALYGCDIGNDDRIPFFALHPPVYYSRIVPRAYGWSPSAYSPDAIVLPLEDGGPKEIINPYVPPSNTPEPKPNTKAKPSAEQTASDFDEAIHLIINPYVGASLADHAE